MAKCKRTVSFKYVKAESVDCTSIAFLFYKRMMEKREVQEKRKK